MQIGVIKEIKDHEHRVALTPAGAQALRQAGHTVYVLQLAQHGLDALRADPGFGKGVNTSQGSVTSQPVAEALGLLAQYKAFVTL